MNNQPSSLDNIYGAGSGNFLKAKDFGDQDRPFLWIKEAVVETKTFRQEEGPKSMVVLSFFNQPDNPLSEKKWSLNKTQALALQQLYGSFENDGWAFKGVRIYKSMTKDRSGNPVATISIYPDPYDMSPEQRQQAAQMREQERAAQAQAAATSFPTHSGPPQGGFSQPQPQQAPPTSGFAPSAGPTSNDPTKNW